MPVMAKNPPRRSTQPTPSSGGKKRPNRSSVPLHVGIPPELRAALDLLIEKTRRPLTTEVVIALENHCRAEGCWPLPAQKSQP